MAPYRNQRNNPKRRKKNTEETPSAATTSNGQPQLPGFYWDSEKKRYFKIQKNHLVQPDAAYSASSVSHRIQQENELQTKIIKAKRNQKRIKRFLHCSSDCLPVAILLQALGSISSSSTVRHYALDYHISQLSGTKANAPRILADTLSLQERQSGILSSTDIRFSYDYTTKSIYTMTLRPSGLDISFARLSPSNPFKYTNPIPHSSHNGSLQFSVLKSGGSLFQKSANYPDFRTSSISSSPGTFAAASTNDIECVMFADYRTRSVATQDAQYAPTLDIQLMQSQCLSANESHDAHRCLALHPSRNGLYVSEGNNLEYLNLKEIITSTHAQHHLRRQFHIEHYRSDILALRFLDAHLLLVGHRDGKIRLFDSRLLNKEHKPQLIARHPGSVTHLSPARQAPRYFIANGIPDAMAMYDIRFLTPQQGANNLATPILKYRHSNSRYPSPNLGFDASPSLNLIAATQGDESIRLFNMSNGVVLGNLVAERISNENSHFSHIQIVDEEERPGVCRVLATRHGTMYDFANHYD